MPDALDRVLKLVAEGRLTAAEAAPILDALATSKPRTGAPSDATDTADTATETDRQPARFARIQVLEGGRRSVDLRIPISLGKLALGRVPGLSGEQISEVHDAIASGTRGPILDIQDTDGDGVRIVLE